MCRVCRYAEFSTAASAAERIPPHFEQVCVAPRFAFLLSMPERDLKKRTKAFGVAIVCFVRTLPYDIGTHHIVDQLLRAAARVGANYRASCRAKSNADFISKMAWVEEEA